MEEFRKHEFLLKFIQTQYDETFVNDVKKFLQSDKQPDRVFQPKPMTYADAASIGAHTKLNDSGDTVKHHILLDNHENIGISGKALELFKSYLSDQNNLLT